MSADARTAVLAAVLVAACGGDRRPPLPDDPYTAGRWADSLVADFHLEAMSMLEIVDEHGDALIDYTETGQDARGNTFYPTDSTKAKLNECRIDLAWQATQAEHAFKMRMALDRQTIGLERFRLQFSEWDQDWRDHIDCWRQAWDDPDFAAHRKLIAAQNDSIDREEQGRRIAARRRTEAQAAAREAAREAARDSLIAERRSERTTRRLQAEALKEHRSIVNRCPIEPPEQRQTCREAAAAWFREAQRLAKEGIKHPPPPPAPDPSAR